MKIKVVNKSKNELPKYQSEGASGLDLISNIDTIIKPRQRQLIPTDLYVEIPNDYEIQVRPKSGLALKHGITVLNTPGTVDSDFRGGIGVILINQGEEDFIVNNGDRIAQMVLSKVEKIEWDNVLLLGDTKRGSGGFGSTGNK